MLGMNKLPMSKRVQILSMLVEGSSMRSISRVADVSINTISALLVDAGKACSKHHDETMRNAKNYHPTEQDNLDCWAKADMVMNLARHRLDGFKVGRRVWNIPEMLPSDLENVKRAVLHGLGMGHLISKPLHAIQNPYPGHRALRPSLLGRSATGRCQAQADLDSQMAGAPPRAGLRHFRTLL